MLSAYDFGRLVNIVTARNPKNASLDNTTQLFQADELAAMQGLNYDLLDKYWKTGYTQKHNVNVSGATDNVNYFASVGYFKQDGNMGNLDYDRWNYRAGIDVKISKWLSAGLTISGDYGKRETPYITNYVNMDYSFLMTHPRHIPEEVGGKAWVEDGVAFLNVARLGDEGTPAQTLSARANREALRAYAHLMEVPPCPFPLCVLTHCGSVEALDGMSRSYCPPCWERLRLAAAERGFDVLPVSVKANENQED